MTTCVGNDDRLIISARNVITIIPQCRINVSFFIRTILFSRWEKYALEKLEKPIGLTKLLEKQCTSVLFTTSLAVIMKCGFDASLVASGPIHMLKNVATSRPGLRCVILLNKSGGRTPLTKLTGLYIRYRR